MRRPTPLAALLVGFVLLGMPGAALGVAWPDMAESFGRNLGDLAVISVVSGVAYGTMSLAGGRLTQRFSAGRLMVLGAASAVFALAIIALADSFWWAVAAAVPLGFSGGAIDAIGNGYFAVFRGARAMGAIHAAYGLGAAIAPFYLTWLIANGVSWRIGFASLAVAEVALVVLMALVASEIRMPMEGRTDRPVRWGRKRLLGLSVWTFFIYSGVELSIGAWAFTLLSEGQMISVAIAGTAVSLHWVALFASRLLLSYLGDRLPANLTIGVSAVGVLVGVGLVWWNPYAAVTVAGLVIAGFFSGPIFPLETTLTSARFGAEYAPWAVGYQLGGATFSVAVFPLLIGYMVNTRGPLAIAPILFVISILLLVSVEALRVASERERSADAPVAV